MSSPRKPAKSCNTGTAAATVVRSVMGLDGVEARDSGCLERNESVSARSRKGHEPRQARDYAAGRRVEERDDRTVANVGAVGSLIQGRWREQTLMTG